MEEVPLKIHTTIANAVGHPELHQIRQLRDDCREVEVVSVRTIPGVAAQVGVFVVLRLLFQRWKQLMNVEASNVGRGQRQRFEELCGVGFVGDKHFDDLFKIAFEIHALPAVIEARNVTDVPSLFATAFPEIFIFYQMRSDFEGDVSSNFV